MVSKNRSTIHALLLGVYLVLICCAQDASAFVATKLHRYAPSSGCIISAANAPHHYHQLDPVLSSSANGDGGVLDEGTNPNNTESESILGVDMEDLHGLGTNAISRAVAGSTRPRADMDVLPVHTSVSADAGPLWKEELCDDPNLCTVIPHRGRFRKRVLILCTGGKKYRVEVIFKTS